MTDTNGTTRALLGATPDFNYEAHDDVYDDEPTICHKLADELQWRRYEAGFAATTVCGITDTWDMTVSAGEKGSGPGASFIDCPLCDGLRGGSL